MLPLRVGEPLVALSLLEKQGLLVPQGMGKRGKIVPPTDVTPPALGQRKIAQALREEHGKSRPGLYAQTSLDELELHGISTGNYNLPDWEDRDRSLT